VQAQEAEERQLTKPIIDFALKVKAKVAFDPDLVVEKGGRYFLLNKNLKAIASRNFFYAGRYLGKVKDGKFFPSFNLLAILAEAEANKVVVDEKAAWLFICARDIFGGGIVSVQGSRQRGAFTLVLNEFGECLGFGRIVRDLGAKDARVVVQNVSDVGDFLRRER
jgi:ribosome biogenesis protein Nip4